MKHHISKIPKRKIDSNKGDFGHVFVLAGSRGLTGAAYLASQSALRTGSGLVTLGVPESLNAIMEVKLTEVMTLPLPETKAGTLSAKAEDAVLEFSKKADVAAIGPGISVNGDTIKLVQSILVKLNSPVVLDADGLNSIADCVDVLKKRKGVTVVTPHPGEMARLAGCTVEAVQKDRESVAKSFSLKYNCVSILKGYRTVVVSPEGDIYVNDTGNTGMSTAGSGDVLTGMVASFMGQGIDAYSASVLAVYFHGMAGDAAARDVGPFGMIAGDILDRVPQVLKDEV
ncbi:MAG: NAD(P)H-hydrate dehydratase [Candidatus Omnitrophota bacterium]